MLIYPLSFYKGKLYGGFSTDFSSPEKIAKVLFDLWYNSPGHKANMLRESFKTMSLGVQVNETGKGVEPFYSKNQVMFMMVGVQIFSSYTDDEIIELKKNGPIEIEGIYFE